MENLKLIGRRIKEIRKKQGISQEHLAEITGINYRTVLRIENGHTSPSLNTLYKIASSLHCTVTDFFEYRHLQSREVLLREILKKLETLPDDELKSFYVGFCLI